MFSTPSRDPFRLPPASSPFTFRPTPHSTDSPFVTTPNTIPLNSAIPQAEETAPQLLFNLGSVKEPQFSDKARIQGVQVKNGYDLAPCQPTLSQQLNAINSRINRTAPAAATSTPTPTPATPTSSTAQASASAQTPSQAIPTNTPKPVFASPDAPATKNKPQKTVTKPELPPPVQTSQHQPAPRLQSPRERHKQVARQLHMEEYATPAPVNPSTPAPATPVSTPVALPAHYHLGDGDDKSLQAVKLLQQTEERKALLSQAEELLRRANLSLTANGVFKHKVNASILRHSMQVG